MDTLDTYTTEPYTPTIPDLLDTIAHLQQRNDDLLILYCGMRDSRDNQKRIAEARGRELSELRALAAMGESG